MCEHGDTILLLVPIPANLSHIGELYWDYRDIDRCIAYIVMALNSGGILTANSCCGHGKSDGSIVLHDGRELIIKMKISTSPKENQEEESFDKFFYDQTMRGIYDD